MGPLNEHQYNEGSNKMRRLEQIQTDVHINQHEANESDRVAKCEMLLLAN